MHLASSPKLTSVRWRGWQAAWAQVLTAFGDTRLLGYPGRQKRGSLAKPWAVLPNKRLGVHESAYAIRLASPHLSPINPHKLLTSNPGLHILASDTDHHGWRVPTRDSTRSMYGPDVRPVA
jgi:hypothetical protein